VRSYVICTAHQNSDYHIKKTEIGEACSTYGGEGDAFQNIGGET
jgi:hypothetical protein